MHANSENDSVQVNTAPIARSTAAISRFFFLFSFLSLPSHYCRMGLLLSAKTWSRFVGHWRAFFFFPALGIFDVNKDLLWCATLVRFLVLFGLYWSSCVWLGPASPAIILTVCT
ncbi:hypothetical protein B0H67DRAFT_187958 [Lasiosphaeris hirsuta]|uniref:Uncharacterized protein n=1 Tax=Lasiosphaeris hirsuta TaxID=260670 RepID=A0AA40E2P2_9PEZI|nr:hypothetical protein B0H67DRAFT_187958 [Lasiosphaeris hirsuta]